ncbi:MAG: hypothetical protein K6D97_09280 [Clostridia bacterium]|nr:hypothetical protein [Clostridia bacterium]
MKLVAEGVLAFILLFVLPTIVGGIIKYFYFKDKGNDKKVNTLFFSFAFGYLTEFTVFEIISVPLILFGASFSVMVWCFIIWNIVLCAYSIYLNYFKDRKNSSIKNDFIKQCENIKNLFSNKTTLALTIAAVILIGIQIYVPTVYMHEDDDDIFYVGTAVTSLYENSMFKVNPRIGEDVGIEWKYVLGPFPLYNAVISRLIHIHPTITAHTILPGAFILLCYSVLYLLAKRLFRDDTNSVVLFLVFMSLINIFGNYSIRTPSTFLLFRIWQGKAMLANYIIPMVWLLWLMQEDEENRFSYVLYVIAVFAATFTTTMGMIFVPLILCVLALIRFIQDRNFKRAFSTALCCSPIAIYGVIFLVGNLIEML